MEKNQSRRIISPERVLSRFRIPMVRCLAYRLSVGLPGLKKRMLSIVLLHGAWEWPKTIASRFHGAVAGLILRVSLDLRQQIQINRVALSGGVFQNVTLLESAVRLLEKADFEVFVHYKVPPNDGGLALGQAVIAARTFRTVL